MTETPVGDAAEGRPVDDENVGTAASGEANDTRGQPSGENGQGDEPHDRPPAQLHVEPVKRSIIAPILIILFSLLSILVLAAGGLYFADTPVDATVTDRQCSVPLLGGGNTITVKTALFGIEHTLTDIPTDQCVLVQNDSFVRYRIRSERTSVWESQGGACIWDTVHGPNGCDR